MFIEVLGSDDRTLADCLESYQTNSTRGTASAAFVHFDCTESGSKLQSIANSLASQVHGATSCQGAMSHSGHSVQKQGGGAAFLIYDDDGDYGSACAPLGENPRAAAQSVTSSALEKASRPGEVPDLIWLSTSPGSEESVLLGIIDVVGEDVPIIGGSAADNTVSGNWYMFDNDETHADAVLVTVLFPSGAVSFAYQNGYAPTEKYGTVTKADGRKLIEIDGQPATDVYSEWTNAAFLSGRPKGDQNILAEATFWPLGREIGQISGIPQYILAHPANAHSDGSMSLFADVSEGEILTQMTGDVKALAQRAGRVAAMAQGNGVTHENAAGALMVYCGGCMLAVQDHMDTVVDGVKSALPNVPMLGTFTFGEQGQIQGKGNQHGNLMISCILFERG